MARAAIVLVLLVAIAYASAYPQQAEVPNQHDEPEQCGPNEEFKTCGTACEEKCGAKMPPICTLKCVIGCQCKEGYVRNKDNQCVLTRDC